MVGVEGENSSIFDVFFWKDSTEVNKNTTKQKGIWAIAKKSMDAKKCSQTFLVTPHMYILLAFFCALWYVTNLKYLKWGLPRIKYIRAIPYRVSSHSLYRRMVFSLWEMDPSMNFITQKKPQLQHQHSTRGKSGVTGVVSGELFQWRCKSWIPWCQKNPTFDAFGRNNHHGTIMKTTEKSPLSAWLLYPPWY